MPTGRISEHTRNVLIPQLQEYFATQPVQKAWLFGSFSRGEEQKDSDVDVLVRFDEGVTLMCYARIYRLLKQLLNKDVDLVEEGTLLPFAVDSAEHDKLLIYERKD
ncbi:MAG: nucleotidyltransferase domain-containing protein [Bacteroidaceae bacterium]|nr:nucleotidyltransferase domain-containing protein [Bacteroidaceae bacterium]